MEIEINDEKYMNSEQRLNSEQSNLNWNNKSLTLSQATYYNQEKQKKSPDHNSSCGKIRNIILKTVKSLYFQLIVILLSIYSLIDKELLLLCLPKTYDYTFHRLIECVFCLYCLEFILLFIGKNNYWGSFDFYLDLFAIISIVTETEVIWENFMHEVVHIDYSVDSLSSFANFEKTHIANSVGSKATKYIRILNILKYIKVIRIAKIARNTNSFTITLFESNIKKDNEFRKSKGIFDKIRALGIRFRRNPLIARRKSNNSHSKTIVQKKNQTTQFLPVIKFDSNVNVIPNEENNFTITPKLITTQKYNKTETIKPMKLNLNDTLHENVKNKKNVQFNQSKDINDYEKQNIGNEQFESSPLKNFRLSSIHHLINNKTLALLNNDSFHENNKSSINKDNQIYSKSHSKGQDQSMISEEANDYMDELEEKKIKSRIEVFKSLSQQIKIESNLFLQELKSRDSNLHVKDAENETGENKEPEKEPKTKDISNKMHSKLEKKLLDNVSKQILFLIIFIVVSLPTIDIDFLFSLVYNDVTHLNKHEYCLSLIFLFMNYSLQNQDYLSTVNKTIENCFSNVTDGYATSGYRNLIYLDFNESNVFYDLQNKTGFMNDEHFIKISYYDIYIKQYRKKVDYYTDKIIFDDYNNFTYIYDNRMYSVVYSITSLFSSFYVSVILIIASYYSKYKIQSIVIIPLDIIFTKLQLNLKHVEIHEKNVKILEDKIATEISVKSFELKDFFQNSILEDISLNHISVDTPLKKDEIYKEGLETYFINKSLFMLLDMISSTVGKFTYLLVPYLELERDHFLNLKTPSIEFEGYAVILNISNTDLLMEKYSELSIAILSRVYALFHSIGIIFLGEPYSKTNLHSIIWKKERKDCIDKMNKYALNILNLRQYQEEIEGLDISNDSFYEKDQIYDMICADLAVFCGVKFFHEAYNNLNKTMQILIECQVSINVFATAGKFRQLLIGDADKLDQAYSGEIIDEYALISKQVNYNQQYSSIFINENVLPHLSQEIKNYIFPYEYIEVKNKQCKIYRHYFNYNCIKKDIVKDKFNYKKMKKEQFFKKRSQFENYILKNNNSFINFVISDDSYVEVVSKLNPTLRTLVNFAYEEFEKKQFDRCISLIRDFKKLIKHDEGNYDYVFIQNILKLEEVVKILKNK